MDIRGKRYLVFAGDTHHSEGGWSDFVMATDDRKVALRAAKQQEALREDGWVEVIDLRMSLPVLLHSFI